MEEKRMEEKLKEINDAKIEETIAEAFGKLLECECKCKIASRLYPKPKKAIFKIEITETEQDIIIEFGGKQGGGEMKL